MFLLHQGIHDGPGVQIFQIGVRLTGAHKDDGLAGDVGHGDGRADLVVDGVEFGEDDAVDDAGPVGVRVVGEGLVELHHLVHGLVTHQGLPDKQHHVRLVHCDKLRARRIKYIKRGVEEGEKVSAQYRQIYK